jgi:glycosyltransferase involved in cell wall biosynthesis
MRPGGIETMVLDLVRRSSYRSHIVSLEGRTPDLIRDWPALAQYATQIDGLDRQPGISPSVVLRLAAHLRRLKPKAVFVHHIAPLIYGGVAARLARVPRLVHVEHDAWHYQRSRNRTITQLCDTVLRPVHCAVSDAIATTLKDIVQGRDVTVIPPGVDLERFGVTGRDSARQALRIPSGARVIGTVGRLAPPKGHAILIEALSRLPDDVVLVIVGDGSERAALVQQAHHLGVDNRTRFLGHRDDLEQILPAFDVFCLPSLNEGLPRALMESQAADIPVIATDVGSVRQIVCPQTGVVVPARDGNALAKALMQALAQPRQRGRTRQFAEQNFSFARTVQLFDSAVLA